MIGSGIASATRVLPGVNVKADINNALHTISDSRLSLFNSGSYQAQNSFFPTSPNVLLSSNTDLLEMSMFENPVLIGTLWFLSSSIFTTYTTMRFLRHGNVVNQKSKKKDEIDWDRNTSSFGIQKHKGQWHKWRLSMYGGNGHTMTLVSPTTSVSTTESVLDKIPPASLLTMYRFAGSLLIGLLFLQSNYSQSLLSLFLQRCSTTIHYATNDFLLPAVFLFLANILNAIALDRIGISLTYTSKCGIPLITVLLTVLLDGWNSLPSSLALLSLLPIGLGIGAASWNSPTFKLGGFVAAVGSTTCQSLLNVYSKRALSKTGITGVTAQRSMAAVGLVLSIVFTAIQLIGKRQQLATSTNTDGHRVPVTQQVYSTKRPLWMPFFAAIAYHVEYVLSFTFVSLVNPISYGTCDAIRRLSTILVGRAMFGGAPLTRVNILGITLALSGALLYSIVS